MAHLARFIPFLFVYFTFTSQALADASIGRAKFLISQLRPKVWKGHLGALTSNWQDKLKVVARKDFEKLKIAVEKAIEDTMSDFDENKEEIESLEKARLLKNEFSKNWLLEDARDRLRGYAKVSDFELELGASKDYLLLYLYFIVAAELSTWEKLPIEIAEAAKEPAHRGPEPEILREVDLGEQKAPRAAPRAPAQAKSYTACFVAWLLPWWH